MNSLNRNVLNYEGLKYFYESISSRLLPPYLINAVDRNTLYINELQTQLLSGLSIPHGGTGATNPTDARNNLEITPQNIGAAPVIDATTSAFDLNTLIKSGLHFGFYQTNSQTQNTPYKAGLTNFSAAMVMSFGNETNYAIQISYTSGTKEVFVRENRNGTISDWGSMLGGVIPVENGGTGATTASAALTNLNGVGYTIVEDISSLL